MRPLVRRADSALTLGYDPQRNPVLEELSGTAVLPAPLQRARSALTTFLPSVGGVAEY